MGKTQSVISLDPIDRKKKKGVMGRLMITRYGGGKKIKKMEAYGHYMFCGAQGGGKTASAIWYVEKLTKKYKKRGKKVVFYSNMGVGEKLDKGNLFDTIDKLRPSSDEVRIVLVDEIHTYYPKDGMANEAKKECNKVIALFSQLRKRSTFIISTAQVYGRLYKPLREQCLYMVNCTNTFTKKLKNEFIKGDDILCDELGRWAGDPSIIYKHGLPKKPFDTKKIIT